MKENILFQIKNIRWQNVEGGELLLTAKALDIYEKRGLLAKLLALFGRMPLPALRVDVSRIDKVETDSLGHLLIEGGDESGGTFSIAVMLDEAERPEEVARILRDTLAEVLAWKIEEKRQMEERQERDRRRLAETQTVLNAARQVWEIILTFRRMIMALVDEDWETAKATYQQVGSLMADESLNPDAHLLSSLGEAIEAESSKEAYGIILLLFRSTAGVIEASAEMAGGESDEQSTDYSLSPGGCHLPYFLLFALLYMETTLYHDIGDDEAVGENIPQLQRLVPILREKFDLDLEKDVRDLAKALGIRDFPRIEKASLEMESHLDDRLKQWEYRS